MDFASQNILFLFDLARAVWWIVLPPIAIYLALDTWLYYITTREIKAGKWVLLEIKIPREILKTPEAMERVFSGLHGPYDPPENFKDFYLKPKIRWWYNFEIVGHEGDIRFYLYCPKSWKGIVESQMYAQYPDVSISEAEDYTKGIPDTVPTEDYDLWGTEFQLLRKEDAYPVITYRDFTSLSDPQIENEALKVDPLSAFAETLAKLGPGEQMWFQILARPCGPPGLGPKDKWQEEGQKLVDKLSGRPEKPKASAWYAFPLDLMRLFFEEIGILFSAIFSQVAAESEGGIRGVSKIGVPPKEEKKEISKLQHITPGEKDVIGAIERKISKHGFETVIRVIYVARKDVMDKAKIGAIFGIIKQFNTQHLNAFKPTGATLTKKMDYLFGFLSSTKYEVKIKRGLLYSYKHRSLFWDMKEPLPLPPGFFSGLNSLLSTFLYFLFPNSIEVNRSKPIVLNTEELATLFHFPGGTVSSPLMPRMQAKQVAPPPDLPIG